MDKITDNIINSNSVIKLAQSRILQKKILCFAVPTCPALTLTNGKITYNYIPGDYIINGRYPEYSSAFFRCNNGYLLQGEYNLFCLSSGHWSQQTPTCTSKHFL